MAKDQKGYCILMIRVDPDTAFQIEKLKEETGLSVREILGYSDKTCDCCKNTQVVAFNSKDKTIKIPRGILFHALLKKHSTYEKGSGNSSKAK